MSSWGKSTARPCAPASKKPAAKPAIDKSKIKPSDKLNPKTVDPFKASRAKSAFADVYTNGGIPCRLMHGSVKHKLNWSTDPERVPFDPTLVQLAEGLKETIHPYYFVARQGFGELLSVRNAAEQTIPLLTRLAPPIKAALISKDDGVFSAGLTALVQLSCVVGPYLNPHLKMIIPAVAKRSMERKHKDTVVEALQQIEMNGGKEALMVIKSKIPTYSSACRH